AIRTPPSVTSALVRPLEISGAVSGNLTVRSVGCAPTAGNQAVNLTGSLGVEPHGLTITAPRPGAYQLGTGAGSTGGATVQFSRQAPVAGSPTRDGGRWDARGR